MEDFLVKEQKASKDFAPRLAVEYSKQSKDRINARLISLGFNGSVEQENEEDVSYADEIIVSMPPGGDGGKLMEIPNKQVISLKEDPCVLKAKENDTTKASPELLHDETRVTAIVGFKRATDAEYDKDGGAVDARKKAAADKQHKKDGGGGGFEKDVEWIRDLDLDDAKNYVKQLHMADGLKALPEEKAKAFLDKFKMEFTEYDVKHGLRKKLKFLIDTNQLFKTKSKGR